MDAQPSSPRSLLFCSPSFMNEDAVVVIIWRYGGKLYCLYEMDWVPNLS
jgi:hypothetical protein